METLSDCNMLAFLIFSIASQHLWFSLSRKSMARTPGVHVCVYVCVCVCIFVCVWHSLCVCVCHCVCERDYACSFDLSVCPCARAFVVVYACLCAHVYASVPYSFGWIGNTGHPVAFACMSSILMIDMNEEEWSVYRFNPSSFISISVSDQCIGSMRFIDMNPCKENGPAAWHIAIKRTAFSPKIAAIIEFSISMSENPGS